MDKRILIMAGGTGGHIFPGLAIANEMQARGWQVDWLGTADRMEAELVPNAGYAIHFINIQGVRNKGLIRKLMTPVYLLKAVWQARAVIKQCRIDVVAGFGGYVSLPGGLAAKLMGLPLVIHEQNAHAGLSNRILARFATQTLCAFSPTAGFDKTAKIVGNPVRRNILGVQKKVAENSIRILVIGGSLGAQVLNKSVPEALAECLADNQLNVQVCHQTGKGQVAEVQAAYQSVRCQSSVNEFIDDMGSAYQNADLVICRAGALTVSEISAVGVAAIFVPLPHAVDDHQTKNAQILASVGAATVIAQHELQAGALVKTLNDLFAKPEKLLNMAENAKKVAKRDAHITIASQIELLTVGNS